MAYPGLFNSTYHPSPIELFYINTPTDQLGSTEAGQVVVALLQGMMIVQYWEYLKEFREEKKWTKWLVHVAFVLCLAKFAYLWAFAWDRFVPHYGDWKYLATFSAFGVPTGISSTIPSAVCQIFYIHRCWALSRNLFFAIPAVFSLILTVGSGISLTYGAALTAAGNMTVSKLIITSINLSLSSALVCDVFITTFTCFYLIREKTGFEETDSLVMRLVKCSIESAAGPTVVAMVNLILSNMATDNTWFLLPNFALSHVYGCSLLYSVNARKSIRMRSPVSTANTRMKTGNRNTDYPLQDRSHSMKQEVFVKVQTAVREDDDMQQHFAGSDGTIRSQTDHSYARVVASHDKPEYLV